MDMKLGYCAQVITLLFQNIALIYYLSEMNILVLFETLKYSKNIMVQQLFVWLSHIYENGLNVF